MVAHAPVVGALTMGSKGEAFLLVVVGSWCAVHLLSWGVAQLVLMVVK